MANHNMLFLKSTSSGTSRKSLGNRLLPAAGNVCVSRQLNDDETLEFDIPESEAEYLVVGRQVVCNDRTYKVINITEKKGLLSVKCQHLFVYSAKRVHIPSIASTDSGDFIGEDLYNVLIQADRNATAKTLPFSLLQSDADFSERGLIRLGENIDYEAEDRVTLWDVMQNIISYSGRGEIYYDNAAYGLVERIGSNTCEIIYLEQLSGVEIETDITDLITQLYPYGDNGMDITGASQNTDGTPYIISPMAYEYTTTNILSTYGIVPGNKVYKVSDIEGSGPDKLFERAAWEFDADNPDRIDMPSYNISGNREQLGISERVKLGDTVAVADKNGKIIQERVISIKTYPYSGKPDELSIGRVKRDMYFYLNRLGVIAQKYNNISSVNGKIYGSKITGKIT